MNILNSFRHASFKKKMQLFTLGFFTILLLVIVPISCVVQIDGQSEKQFNSANISNFQSQQTGGYVVRVNCSSLDFTKKTASFIFQFETVNIPKVNNQYPLVIFTTDSVSKPLSRYSPVHRETITLPIIEGSTNLYPFHTIKLDSMFSLTNGNLSVPLEVVLGGVVDGFTTSFDFPDFTNPSIDSDGIVTVRFKFTTSITTRIFSTGIGILMWTLALSISWLAISLWLRDRKVEPPTIGIAAGLLFALPPVRNSQPNIPPIGCVADLASFLWCMVLISMSLILLIWNYIMKYKADPVKKAIQKVEEFQIYPPERASSRFLKES